MCKYNRSLIYIVTMISLIFTSQVYSQATVFKAEDYDYRVVTVVKDVKDPWSIAFLPNGDMLFTERPGRLRIVRDGKLDPEPIAGIGVRAVYWMWYYIRIMNLTSFCISLIPSPIMMAQKVPLRSFAVDLMVVD